MKIFHLLSRPFTSHALLCHQFPSITPSLHHSTPHAMRNSPEPAPLVNRKSSIANRKRNGKVASLSKPHRDLVNHMLEDGASYPQIVAALNEFGISVSTRNVSNWYRGGFQDRLDAQQRINAARLQQDALLDLGTEDPTALPRVGLQLAATRLTELLLLSQPNPAAPDANLTQYLHLANCLCRITSVLVKLQESAAPADQSPSSLEPFVPLDGAEDTPSPDAAVPGCKRTRTATVCFNLSPPQQTQPSTFPTLQHSETPPLHSKLRQPSETHGTLIPQKSQSTASHCLHDFSHSLAQSSSQATLTSSEFV